MGSLIRTAAGTLLKTGNGPVSPYHAVTQAAINWLAGVGVTLTQPQIDALDRHVRDLHGESNPNYTTVNIWTKIRAIYPMIGSTATAHTLNLVNTALPLVFSGAIIHSATGSLFDGGFANTGFNLSNQPALVGGGYYSRKDYLALDNVMVGSSTNIHDAFQVGFTPGSGGFMLFDMHGINIRGFYASTTTKGYFSASRIPADTIQSYFNGTLIHTRVGASEVPNSLNIYLGANNLSGVASTPSFTECAYAQINYGLSPAEELAYYNSIQAYQTALSRQIVPPSPYDADALIFFNAVAAVSTPLTTPQKDAVDLLVRTFKTNGTWAKKQVIYPMIGGTAAAHAINLRNPATFQITWSGTPLHNSNGVTFDGASFGNTGYDAFSHFTTNNGFLAYYSSLATGSNAYDFAAADVGFANQSLLICRYGSIGYAEFGLAGGSYTATFPVTNDIGMYHAVRDTGTTIGYKSGVVQVSVAKAVVGFTSRPFYIGGINLDGVLSEASSRRCSYAELSSTTHTATDVMNDYTAIQAYQTTLGRAVSPTSFLAATLIILSFLLTQGINLTSAQMEELDALIRGAATPAPAGVAPAKKSRKKVKTKTQQVNDYLKSIGVEADISKLQLDE